MSVITVEFVVCKTLAALVVLGCDFFVYFVDAIKPRLSWDDSVDVLSIPFAGKPWEGSKKSPAPLPPARQQVLSRVISIKLRMFLNAKVSENTQTCVTVKRQHRGSVLLEHLSSQFERNRISTARGRALVENDKPFKVLIANH